MKRFVLSLLIMLCLYATVQAQINVGSNTAPDSSAMLQISGNTKGFLPPRMTRDSMYLIHKPAKGLIVFNTSDSLLYMHRDTGWVALAASGLNAWLTNGNSGTSSGTNFLGTTDFTSLRFRTNNAQRLLIDSLGNVGIGTTTPAQKLDVAGSINASANVLAQASAVVDASGTNNGTSTPGVQFGSTGSGEAISSKRTSGGNQAGLDFYTNFSNRMTITNAGNVGIGTSSPSTALHVVGTNPLTLNGVQPGTNTPLDSVLTINNGLVSELPLSTFTASVNGITTADAPLTYSNGELGITQASTTSDGYISAGDYNIFNNKVNSIALTANVLYPTTSFTVTGGAATATLPLNTQGSNKVFAGPVSGGNVAPSFRSLVAADLPKATTSTLGAVSVGSGLSVTVGGVLSAINTNSGTVTSVSVLGANGLAGTVLTPTTTPAITLSTTVTGIVKGNGTALSAATSGTDYAPGTAGNGTGIVKSTNGTGALTTATALDFPTLNQNTTGTASNITGVLSATSLPALTGDVTSTAGSATTTISNGAITNAKMANMAANTFKANNTGSSAAPSDITTTQATAMLDVFTSTTKGLVPASGGGTAGFLRADGTFAVPPGTNTNAGTVTSVAVTSANGVSGTVANNTTTPAISLTLGAITPTSVAATGTVTGSNLSGTNTGDETGATIKTKLGPATTTNDGYLTSTDWNTFNNKASTANVISSLNGLTSNSQTFATPGTTGTAPAWSSAGSIHTLNIPLASASGVTAGLLSNTDWNTFNNKATATGTWSTTGNSGTNYATNFLGTTDNKSLRFRTNNMKRMILDSIGNVAVGTDTFDAANPEKFLINAGNTNSVNGLVAKGSINNYFQFNIKNASSGANATSDIVATADNGTESSNYVDLGINGSGYTGSAIQTGVANDGYLISSGNDFYMVNSSANKNMLFLTGGTGVANERMRILANGRVGMGVQDPTAQFVVKDTMEIRRTGSLSQLLFTNTAGTGDFRIGGDGGDFYWQGGGSRNLQMGSYWTTVLGGDRQGNGGTYPAFAAGTGGTGVLVLGQRDASVPFAIQGNSATQSANLTEWRNSSGTALNVINNNGNLGLGTTNPTYKLQVSAASDPLSLLGVQTGSNTDSIVTILNGVVRKLSPSALAIPSSNAWALVGNSNTSASNYFLGTTTSDPLIFKVNNQIAGRLDASNTFLGSLAGNNNGTTANQNTGIGIQALALNTSGTYNTAIGYNSLPNNVSGSNNIGVGYNAAVANNSSNSIAIGINSYVNNASSIAVGTSAQTNNTSALAIGNYTYVNGQNGIAIGNGSSSIKTQAYGTSSTALGYNAYAGGTNSIAIGSATSATLANAVSIGNASSATGTNSVAIGYNAAAVSDNTIVLGDKSNAAVSVAIGSENFSASPNREKLLVDATTIGSFNVISAKGNLNNYLQLNVQNRNGGANASSDLVATTDNGDENNNYVDLGINSSGNTSNLWGAAGDAYLYTQTNNMLIGTAGNSKVLAFLTGGGTQSTNERMRIDGNGNVGIGTTSPSTKLHIVGTNPLTLTGVQTGTNTSADSMLTITSGLVRKIPLSTLNVSTAWSLTGNAGTTSGSNFLGTTDYTSLKLRTNNTQTMLLDSLGNVAIGSAPSQTSGNVEKLLVDAGTTNSFNVISGKGNLNNYLQLNIQNRNNGGNASSDIVATADNGDENNNYVDLGINSSGNNTNNFGSANDAYLYAQSQNMLIGTASANKSIAFLTGGGTQSTNERMRITGAGRVGIGTNAPASDLTIYQSSGTGNAKGFTFTGNSIGGASSGTGFLMSLGYNATTNKQLWLGDADDANNANGTFARFSVGGNSATLDAVKGDNSQRRFLAIGVGADAASGAVFGGDGNSTHPGSYVWDNGNFTIGNGYRSNAAPSNGLLVQGNVGVGTTSPTAILQLGAGTASTGTAPLKLTSGTNLSTPETGAVEFDGTNYFATSGSTRYTLAKTLTNTATLDFPNTSNGSVSTLTITVTGARDGDVVDLGVPSSAGASAGTFSAYVSGNDTVTVKFINPNTTNGIDPVPGTFRVSVLKY